MEWYRVSAFTGSLELLITTHVHLVSFPDHHHVFWVLNAFCFSMMIQFCILNSDPNWWNPESKLSSACANSVYRSDCSTWPCSLTKAFHASVRNRRGASVRKILCCMPAKRPAVYWISKCLQDLWPAWIVSTRTAYNAIKPTNCSCISA